MKQFLLKKIEGSMGVGSFDSYPLFFGSAIYVAVIKWYSRYTGLLVVMKISHAWTVCSWPGFSCGWWGEHRLESTAAAEGSGAEPAPLRSVKSSCPGLQLPISLQLSFEKCG